MVGVFSSGATPGRVCARSRTVGCAVRPALVLLSGGMDSTACLHWALGRYDEVRAIGFDYGQRHRDAELVSAGKLARRRGVPFETLCLADSLHGGLKRGVPEHDRLASGVHPAFVPGRNLVFLSLALGRACIYWPNSEDTAIVIGACHEDTSGFPDCGQTFLRLAQAALSAAVLRLIRVEAPFVTSTKRDLVGSFLGNKDALADIQASWSCYAGTGPCGICTPCVLRRDAFDAHGLSDLCCVPTMFGGDVARDRRFGG